MIIGDLSSDLVEFNDGTKLAVRGVLRIGEAGHQLPFYYTISPGDDFDHSAYLEELDRQGQQLVPLDTLLRAWVGHTEVCSSGGEDVTMTISDCQMMFHAHSRWEVYCGWWETYDGQNSHHQVRWPCSSPELGPTLATVKQHVLTLVGARVAMYAKAVDQQQKLSDLKAGHGLPI